MDGAVIQLWYTMHKNEQTSLYLSALGTLNPVIPHSKIVPIPNVVLWDTEFLSWQPSECSDIYTHSITTCHHDWQRNMPVLSIKRILLYFVQHYHIELTISSWEFLQTVACWWCWLAYYMLISIYCVQIWQEIWLKVHGNVRMPVSYLYAPQCIPVYSD